MRLSILSLLVAMLATPLGAQDLPSQQRATALGGLRALSSADAAQPWAGVGRLDTGVSFCSATLVSDRLVVSAAHCLFDPRTGERIADSALTFRAGLRNGRPVAQRGVRRSAVPGAYVHTRRPDLDSISMDLALLELDLPVGAARIAPIPLARDTARTNRRGDDVTVVSYGAEREAHASIEEGCLVLEAHGAVRLLSCHVVQGSSGAPVLRMRDGAAELVAVVSATATDSAGRDISMAVTLEQSLAELTGLLARPAAARSGPLPQVGSPAGDDARGVPGARFLRP